MIWLILLLALGLRFINLNQSLWLDEAAQVMESVRPLSQQLDIAADFHPPLFHVLLHFWLQFGRSEVWLRLLPVFLGIGSIYLTYILVRRLSTQKIALLAALLLAINPFHIWYSQEVRPYMLSVLLGLVSTYMLVFKLWKRYAIATILFLFSLYLAPFLVLAHGVFIAVSYRKLLGDWVKAIAISFGVFLLWLPQFLGQFAIGTSLTNTLSGWSTAVSNPIARAVPLTFAKFFFGRITFDNKILYAGLLLLVVGLCGYLIWRAFVKYKKSTSSLLLLFGLPLISAWLVSFVIPILAPQRILFILPFLVALMAMGISSLGRGRIITLAVFVGFSFYALWLYNTPRFQREWWRETVAWVESNAPTHPAAVFVFSDAFAPWQWYSHTAEGKPLIPVIALAPNLTLTDADLVMHKQQLLTYNTLFVFDYLTDLTDPTDKTGQFLQNLGYTKESTQDMSGVGFIYVYTKTVAFR